MPKTQQRWRVFAAAAFGFVLGVVSVAALSARASRVFLGEAQFSLAADQFRSTSAAFGSDKDEEALAHARCALYIATDRERPPQTPSWPVWYPIVGLASRHLISAIPPNHLLMATAHARVAYVLEAAARSEDAARHYGEAARLLGGKDISVIRASARDALTAQSPDRERTSPQPSP